MDARLQLDASGPYINDFIECQSPSPSSNLSHLDSNITFNPLASPPYNGSYNNSPYSAPSELSYVGESDLSFNTIFDEDSASAIRDYDPADYDAPHQSTLLMFSDTDFISPSYDPGLSAMGAEIHPSQHYDYSSPSSNASAEDRNRSRASSVSSNPHSHHPTPNLYASSPRLDVAQSFENLKFSPNWGTEPLPLPEPMQKHPSPPRLLMPEGPPTINAPDGDGPSDGSVSGPSLNIVPATPISGGGLAHDAAPFQNRLGNLSAHAQPPWGDPASAGSRVGTTPSDSQGTPQLQQQQQQGQFNFLQPSQHLVPTHPRSVPGTPSTRPLLLEDVNNSGVGAPGTGGGATNTSFLFPQTIPKTRSKSDPALDPPNWDTSTTTTLLNQSANNSAIDDGTGPGSATVTMQEVQGQAQSYTSPPSTGQSVHGFNFPPTTATDNNNNPMNNNYLHPGPVPIRRVKSDSSSRPILHRQSQSDEIRSITPLGSPPSTNLSLFYPGSGSVPNSAPVPSSTSGFLSPHPQTHVTRFLSPGLDGSNVPSIRSHRHTRSLTGHLTPNYSPSPGLGPIRRSPSSTRSDRGSVWSEASGYSGGSAGGPGLGSNRISPYPSPKASPRPNYGDLPSQGYDDAVGMGVGRVSGWMAGNQHLPVQQHQQSQGHSNGSMYGIDSHTQGAMLPPGQGQVSGGSLGGSPGVGVGHVGFPVPVTMNIVPPRARVKKSNVTTDRTKKASVKRRKADATFMCPIPGCGSTFTRSFNLRGHMRSHNEEKPFTCRWPGCTKAFARQHDCKRHEALHSNYRPFMCEGCQKQFARMDALNRHLRSESGADCAKVQKPASLSTSPVVGGQATLNGLLSRDASDGYDERMEVDFGQMDDFLGDTGDSSAESSGAEEVKPGMLSAKLEDEWCVGITL